MWLIDLFFFCFCFCNALSQFKWTILFALLLDVQWLNLSPLHLDRRICQRLYLLVSNTLPCDDSHSDQLQSPSIRAIGRATPKPLKWKKNSTIFLSLIKVSFFSSTAYLPVQLNRYDYMLFAIYPHRWVVVVVFQLQLADVSPVQHHKNLQSIELAR